MSDIVNQDLAGFRLAQAYWAERNSIFPGARPFICGEGELVLCADQDLLGRILRETVSCSCEGKIHHIRQALFLINSELGEAFKPVRDLDPGMTLPEFRLVTAESYEAERATAGFRWHLGLIAWMGWERAHRPGINATMEKPLSL